MKVTIEQSKLNNLLQRLSSVSSAQSGSPLQSHSNGSASPESHRKNATSNINHNYQTLMQDNYIIMRMNGIYAYYMSYVTL